MPPAAPHNHDAARTRMHPRRTRPLRPASSSVLAVTLPAAVLGWALSASPLWDGAAPGPVAALEAAAAAGAAAAGLTELWKILEGFQG
jgi:hypothetical protein